jgi:hypothetical protein
MLVRPSLFVSPPIKRITGLQIHHYHYGLVLCLVGVGVLLIGEVTFAIVLLGTGLGLLLDEATTAMLIRNDHKLEFEIYRQSVKSTAFLFLTISLLLLGLASLNHW